MAKAFRWTMETLATAIKARQENEFDCNIIIDGPRGNGKSTFAYKLLTRMGKFKPKKDIVFSRQDVMRSLQQKRKGKIFADEMIVAGHNRDWFSSDQKLLIKMLNMYRDKFNVLIGCIPNFYNLDVQIRSLIKIRITIITRGKALIQFSRNSMYSNDPWETKRNMRIEESWGKKIQRNKKYKPKYNLLSTFEGFMTFGPLSPKQEVLYKGIKEEKRAVLMAAEEEGEGDSMSEAEQAFKKLPIYVQAHKMIIHGEIRKMDELRDFFGKNNIRYMTGLTALSKYRQSITFPISAAKQIEGYKNDRVIVPEVVRREMKEALYSS